MLKQDKNKNKCNKIDAIVSYQSKLKLSELHKQV